MPLHWIKSDMPIDWHLDYRGSEDVNFEDLELAVKASFSTWEKVECSFIDFNYGGTTEVKETGFESHYDPDFKNTLVWVESGWPSELSDSYAVTIPAFDQNTGQIVDADIEFNGTQFKWSARAEGESGKADIQNIATHEIGHVIGLNHPQDQDATMFPYGVMGEIFKRTLASDDIKGACDIYPIEGAVGWPCKDQSDCLDGLDCIEHEDYDYGLCSHSCYCDPDCSSDFRCIAGFCTPPAKEVKKIGGSCSKTLPCQTPYICLDGLCTDFCSEDAQCPAGWDCEELVEGGKACYTSDTQADGDQTGPIITINKISIDLTSPQTPSTKIHINAIATGDENIHCRFSTRSTNGDYTSLKSYSETCEAIWLPVEIGNYEIIIEARQADSKNCHDTQRSLQYTITEDPNGPPPTDGDSDTSDDSGVAGDGGSSGCSAPVNYQGILLLILLSGILFRHRKAALSLN